MCKNFTLTPMAKLGGLLPALPNKSDRISISHEFCTFSSVTFTCEFGKISMLSIDFIKSNYITLMDRDNKRDRIQ